MNTPFDFTLAGAAGFASIAGPKQHPLHKAHSAPQGLHHCVSWLVPGSVCVCVCVCVCVRLICMLEQKVAKTGLHAVSMSCTAFCFALRACPGHTSSVMS